MTEEAKQIVLSKDITAAIVTTVAGELAQINENAENLLGQATRAVVSTEQSLASAGDLVKVARGNASQAEAMRKKIVAPANGFVKQINAMFKGPTLILDQVKSLLEGKMTVHLNDVEAKRRIAADAERKRIEEEALRAAEASAEAQDDVSVEIILETATNAVEDVAPEKIKVHGDYGSTTGTRRVVTGRMDESDTGTAQFLRAIASHLDNGTLPVPFASLIEVKRGGMNSLARFLDENGMEVSGFEVRVESKANVR